MASSSANLKALGLNYSPNQLSLPDGSMTQADNVVIRRDNVVESRRGIRRYSETFGGSTDRAKQLIEYKDRILTHYSDRIAFDTGVLDSDDRAILALFDGTYTETQPGLRIKSIESNKNLYFTTSEGIKKISAVSAADFTTQPGFIQNSGAVKALDINASLQITQGELAGFLPPDSTVAYRAVWGYKDANQNLLLGTPSNRIEIFNFLSDIISMDLNALSADLDNLNQSGSLITDGNYADLFYTSVGSSAAQLQNNVLALAAKLDNNLLYSDTASGGKPLTVNTIGLADNIVTITFSAGDPTQYILLNDFINIVGIDYTGSTIAGLVGNHKIDRTVSSNSIQFTFSSSVTSTTTVGGTATTTTIPNTITPVAPTTCQIFSYNYTNIVNTLGPGANLAPQPLNTMILNIPATDSELETIEDALSRISDRLKIEPSGTISAALSEAYIQPFTITENGNARVEITIPEDITADYFVQIYRSRVFTATFTQTLGGSGGIPVVPDDELRLVFEHFPSTAEVTAGTVIFEDDFPDSLVQNNTNLYTNPETGDGILQANDPPPFAFDINTFKNVTFYANTRTAHTISLFQLLGLSNITSGDKLTIANSVGSDTYTFVTGVKKITNVIFTAGSTVTSGEYYIIYSGTDDADIIFWQRVDGSGAQPTVMGASQFARYVMVDILSTDSAEQVAAKNKSVINVQIFDFSAINGDVALVSDVTSSSSDLVISNISVTSNVVTVNFSSGDPTGYFSVGDSIDFKAFISPLDVLNGSHTINTAVTTNSITFSFTTGDIASTTPTAGQLYTFIPLDEVDITNSSEGLTTTDTAGTSPFTVIVQVNGDGENAATKQVILSSLISAAQAIEETSQSLVRVINKQPDSVVFAYYISGDTTPPGQITLQATNLNDDPFYVLGSSSGIGTSFNPDISPENTNITSISVANPTVLTFGSPHGLQNGDTIIISGSNSTPLIDGEHVVTRIDPTHVSLAINITVAGTQAVWSLPDETTISVNEVNPNRIYYSKLNQPESVPLLNFFDVAAGDKAILRIFPLRDSLFVFKEDGTYRVSGEVAPFVNSLLDSSCVVIAPDTVAVSNNVVYAWTSKGITPVTENGASSEVSRPIDTQILALSSNFYPNFSTLTWGFGYDSDDSYTMYTNTDPSDTTATIGFRYCTLTNTWTNTQRAQTCGVINPSEDLLYLGDGTKNVINRERKQYLRFDYSDDDFTITLGGNALSANGLTLQFTSVDGISIGDVITQEQTLSVYGFNKILDQLDFDPSLQKDYASTLTSISGDNIRTKIVALAAKLDADPGTSFKDYSSRIAISSGTITSNDIDTPTVIHTSSPHGLVEGRIVTISGTENGSIPSIVGTFPVSDTGNQATSTTFSVPINVTTEGATGLSFSDSQNVSNFDDIEACFNDIVSRLNADTGVTFNDYQPITTTTLFEAVITGIDTVKKKITVNLPLQWVVGDVTIYQAIECQWTYAPCVLGDQLSTKQMFDATFMFRDRAITGFTGSFSSDLHPEFTDVPFVGQGNGIFGHYSAPGFGYSFFGGAGNSAPFRTWIPQMAIRCRYINVQVTHTFARESWALYGITLTGNVSLSFRGYR